MSRQIETACLALALAVVAGVVAACGGRGEAPVALGDAAASADAGGVADASAETSVADLPPGVAYVSGGFQCCEKGIGRQCCVPGMPCAAYGGALGACTTAGAGISGKDICTLCCDGLTVISRTHLVGGACVDDGSVDSLVCAPCGDGVCSAALGENACSCPADCP